MFMPMRLASGRPDAVANETCNWLVFNAQGALDLRAALEIDAKIAPTESQWGQVNALVFGASKN